MLISIIGSRLGRHLIYWSYARLIKVANAWFENHMPRRIFWYLTTNVIHRRPPAWKLVLHICATICSSQFSAVNPEFEVLLEENGPCSCCSYIYVCFLGNWLCVEQSIGDSKDCVIKQDNLWCWLSGYLATVKGNLEIKRSEGLRRLMCGFT